MVMQALDPDHNEPSIEANRYYEVAFQSALDGFVDVQEIIDMFYSLQELANEDRLQLEQGFKAGKASILESIESEGI